MLSQNYRNRIIDICCRMISTDGKVTLDERIWMNIDTADRRYIQDFIRARYPVGKQLFINSVRQN